MSESLLRTKLFPPPERRGLVERPRLLELLQAGLQAPARLLLVSAPPGFGKTTLVSAWARHTALPLCWVNLDEGDNDALHFWRYVVSALAERQPALVEPVLRLLNALIAPPITAVLNALINQLTGLEQPLLLVLDDYHHIHAEEVHNSLNFFLDQLPPRLLLAVTTRADPPLMLARRRARGQLCEIRAADLRFTPEEISLLLNRLQRLELLPEDIIALADRTEGWIAGLQMAALSLLNAPDRHSFVQAFHGNDRYIADYLLEEVLQHQPVHVQEFLLITSLLEQLTASLCIHLTGRSDAQQILQDLERGNLFLVPLDNRREWYRYHRLFAELLRQRLVQGSTPEAVRALQVQAAGWFSANGYPVQAVDILLAAGEHLLAAGQIEQYAQQLFLNSELTTLMGWSRRLPESIIAGSPRLCLILGWAAHATGHPRQCEHFLLLSEQACGANIDDYLHGSAAAAELSPVQQAALIEGGVMKARLAMDSFDLDRTFELGERLLPFLTAQRDHLPVAFNLPSILRPPLVFILGMGYLMRGQVLDALAAFKESAEDAERLGNIHIVALGYGHLGETLALAGQLRQAQSAYQKALHLSEEKHAQTSAFFGLSQAGLGKLAYEWNDLETAAGYLLESLDQGRMWQSWEVLLPGGLALARLHEARGDLQAALETLDGLESWLGQNRVFAQPVIDAARAVLQAQARQFPTALAWADRLPESAPRNQTLNGEYERLCAGLVYLLAGKAQSALEILERLLPDAMQAQRLGRAVRILAVQSLALQALGRSAEALERLRSALALRPGQGYKRLFADLGDPMFDLLAALWEQSDPAAREGIELLLSIFPAQVPELPPPPAGLPKDGVHEAEFETLSDRELQVLALIAKGLTNSEIAEKLYLSPNTLKAHTQNIYSKLDVHGRIEALNRAKELGLLPD